MNDITIVGCKTRTDLAMLYFGQYNKRTANRKLKSQLIKDETLRKELVRLGHSPTDTMYTPKQIQAIINAWGAPELNTNKEV